MNVSSLLDRAVGIAWGLPLVVLLLGSGLYLAWLSRLIPLRGFGRALGLVAGRIRHDGDQDAEGQITYFQGLMTAMASTVGLGNISGVALALQQGGPGAIFWMWMAALVGMHTKFFETTMAMAYRGKDFRGDVQGGAMYAIERLFKGPMRRMAVVFAAFGLVGTLGLYQANQLAAFGRVQYGVAPVWTGLVAAAVVGYVLLGGIRRLVRATSTLVPFMCVGYVIVSVWILILNAAEIPAVFARIFEEAFTGQAAVGGAIGVAFIEVVKIGVKRGTFSNESGLGTAPMAHGNVKTSEPVAEGLVAMLGPFFDTIVICTMTALVILTTTGMETAAEADGIIMTLMAFKTGLPGFGEHFLALAVLLFAVTTMIGMANYNRKCWNYLFRGRWYMREPAFIVYFIATIYLGATSEFQDVVNVIDIAYALMAVPNLIATLKCAPMLQGQLRVYLERYGKSED